MTRRTTNQLNRRALLKSAGAVAGLAGMGTMISIRPARAQDTFDVTMQLGWLAGNGQIGEVVAMEKGFYAEEGLSLSIMPGGPNVDGVASVASGRANLGQISSSPSLMLARSAGLPVKAIATGYQKHPFTYFSLKSNPVTSPQDMIGKTIATNGTARILLEALLAANGISEDDVTVQVMGADMAPLMTGQVDVVTGWNTNTSAMKILGDQRVDLTLWDAGVQLYAYPYYVNDETLNEYPEQVNGMIRASARGWGWAYENPQEAVEILLKHYPNLDREDEMATVDQVLGYVFNETTAEHGWGWMTPDNWQRQITMYEELGQFENEPPKLEDVMTMSVLEATADTRPKFGG
ncbi:ABC transporter substrate-binding protein [Thalassorhabdomicrobium marinisediminis]|uniref:ABC transporter substrate-binding protein n=1 Tax=Thalassorhabdomicrobium marinisediminis TaxID=2170577 RepID=UPI00248F9300|nr:ABC transporter substrate-binding protein [Thalassorhabdomicrobium marinisediminis]